MPAIGFPGEESPGRGTFCPDRGGSAAGSLPLPERCIRILESRKKDVTRRTPENAPREKGGRVRDGEAGGVDPDPGAWKRAAGKGPGHGGRKRKGGGKLGKGFYYLLAFGVGLVIAVHLAMNADVGQKIENARAANAAFWVIGAAVAVIIWLASPGRSALARVKDVNPLLLLAGAMGAALVLAIAVIIPRIGAGATNVLQLAGQVTAGILISHFALWSSPQNPVTPLKLVGVAVMVGGACMAVML